MNKRTNYFAIDGVDRFSASTPAGALSEWENEHGPHGDDLPATLVIHEYAPAVEMLDDVAASIAQWTAQYKFDEYIQDNWPEALDPEGDVEFMSAEGYEELRVGMHALLCRVLSRHATVFHCEKVGTQTYDVAALRAEL